MMMKRERHSVIRRVMTLIVVLVSISLATDANAGLRDIHPRPQQMGLVEPEALCIPGTFYLVLPDNLTDEETFVRDEALELIEARVFRVPIQIPWSQYTGQTPALWLATADRLPALVTALDSTNVPGLGNFGQDEEYQIHVGESRILLGASDLRGLRWGIMSLIHLMSEMNGSMYVDRAYVRDWPDLSKRIVTMNASIRNQQQADFLNYVADLADDAKMNEVEWNDPDAGQNTSPFYLANSAAFRGKLRDRGTVLYTSADRTGVYVTQQSWQEGIPQQGTKLRVTSGVLRVVPNHFNISISNAGFETWAGALPTGWQVYRPEYRAYIARDQVTRHSGGSSVKFFGLNPSTPHDLDLRHYGVVVGNNRYLKLKFWYKLSGFTGTIRAMMQTPSPVEGMVDIRFPGFPTPTTQDWTLFEYNFTSGYTDSVVVFLGPVPGTAGTLWLDDVSIEAAPLESIVRRADTPMSVYKEPAHLLMEEGFDYQLTDTSGGNHHQFWMAPRLTTLAGGRLANNDSVTVDWYCAVRYQSGRQTPCFSMMEPLIEYQNKVRVLDSLLRPDGYKIHINEVCYSNYDPLCVARGMTSGEIVGSYCRQMYDIIQTYHPGAPVRIYGDAFDIWVHDNRLHPISEPPWTVGALQELHQSTEMMALIDYSTNLDSSFAYFQANGHASVMAAYGSSGFHKCLSGALAARRHPGTCNGMQFYDWDSVQFDLVPDFADLAWNLGPYIVHTPHVFTFRPASVSLQAELWTDEFRSGESPVLTTKTLRYRHLPSGQWSSLAMTSIGTETYAATVDLPGGITGLEYYIEVTDYRGQTKRAPYNAPTETFVALFPPGGGPDESSVYEEIRYNVNFVGEYPQIEWPVMEGADWYEVHSGMSPEFGEHSSTLISRQQPICPRFLIVDINNRRMSTDQLHVFAVRKGMEIPRQKPERATR